MLPEIEKAILKANLGLTPQNDGNVIRIPIQPLTAQRRKELVKMVTKMAEEYRSSVRNLRREANNQLKGFEKDKLFSEDDIARTTEQIQKITDKYIKEIDQITAAKEKELLEF